MNIAFSVLLLLFWGFFNCNDDIKRNIFPKENHKFKVKPKILSLTPRHFSYIRTLKFVRDFGFSRHTDKFESMCCLWKHSSAVSSAMTFSSRDFTCFSILWNCISVEVMLVILWFWQKTTAITHWRNDLKSTIRLFISKKTLKGWWPLKPQWGGHMRVCTVYTYIHTICVVKVHVYSL